MFWGKIATMVFSGSLSWVGKLATDLYGQKLTADNNSERIVAELAGRELAVEQRERELDNQLLIAEQGNWMTRWVRPMWSMPFVIYTWKVIVYDICLGWGTTPALRGDLAQMMMAISVAYFGGRTIEKVANIIATKRGARK
jgi:hypothetical protein